MNNPAPPWDPKKPAMAAFIDESACIGCTKCLPVCPTDAIMGAAKLMHTVITDACTACELCIPTCPVDCIDMRPLPERSTDEQKILNTRWLSRFKHHHERGERPQQAVTAPSSIEARKQYITEALQRLSKKK